MNLSLSLLEWISPFLSVTILLITFLLIHYSSALSLSALKSCSFLMVFIIIVSRFIPSCNPLIALHLGGVSEYTPSPLNMSYFLSAFHFIFFLTFAPRNLPQGLSWMPLLCAPVTCCACIYGSTYMVLLLTYWFFFPVDCSVSSKRISIFFFVSPAPIRLPIKCKFN